MQYGCQKISNSLKNLRKTHGKSNQQKSDRKMEFLTFIAMYVHKFSAYKFFE
jgi:hypothetical protein